MASKFLYLDDEGEKTARGFIKFIEDQEKLTFDIHPPETWNRQREKILEGYLDEYDGLMLDLKLEFSDGEKNDVKYTGAELAQSIRSYTKAGSIKDLPIFLCSTDTLVMAYFDRTSTDLFDRKYDKESTLKNIETQSELISFAKAYKTISENRSTENLIQKSLNESNDLKILDLELRSCQTPHEVVYLMNNYFIQTEGILMSERLLAIRLGIDIDTSPEWIRFRDEILFKIKYSGILGDYYQRWWAFDLITWWENIFDNSLIALEAKERVDLLSKEFQGFNLNYLPLPSQQQYTTFWYKCRLSNTPLDSTDGLRTIEMPRFIWQDPNYISYGYLISEDRDLGGIQALLGPDEIEFFEQMEG